MTRRTRVMPGCQVFLIFAFFLSVDISLCDVVIGVGPCPTPDPKQDFNRTEFLGDWYEYERFPNKAEKHLVCVGNAFTDTGDEKMHLIQSAMREVREFGEVVFRYPVITSATASPLNEEEPARLRISYTPALERPPLDLYVVETDYTVYALLFSCTEISEFINIQRAWILTRIAGMPPLNILALKSYLVRYAVEVKYFQSSHQEYCRHDVPMNMKLVR
ncbi:apolipoprotein D-like [Aplysia californica]|uniref:Apolipoprotein D-like n=1 Tax=Aplysia californica TaxID=6500 RepID=A0ABM0ZY06_APLCA|nr:apolipoprotein D-like [Aplysia californica]